MANRAACQVFRLREPFVASVRIDAGAVTRLGGTVMERRSLERMAASATPAVVLSAGIDVRSRGRTPTRFDAHPASVPTRIRERGEVSDDQEWAGGFRTRRDLLY